MYVLFLIIASLCVSAFAKSVEQFGLENANVYFVDFINNFDKKYINEDEKLTRFQIFKNNLEEVNRLNKNQKDAVYGITQFMDLTPEEFVAKYTCIRKDRYNLCDTVIYDEGIKDAGAPDSFDWRDKKAVTSVKNQSSCGSCWAFGATGFIEGQYFIKHGELISLSEQQLVDCDNGSSGCHGGFITSAFKTLISEGGQMKESDYKYESIQKKCRLDKSKIVAKVTECTSYNLTSQEKVKQHLYKIGPIPIAIKANVLMFYRGGIISNEECDAEKVNHAVLLVGYGAEGDKPYWIVKNSWGSTFGEEGYFRMQRSDNPNGACSMLNPHMATAIIE